MTQKEATEVRELAKPVYEAIQTIAGERESCPSCRGAGIYQNCSTCHGTGKVGWKWEPEVGEWFMFSPSGSLNLLTWYNDYAKGFYSAIGEGNGFHKAKELAGFIPILPWETIEGILDREGYWLKAERLSFNYCRAMIGKLPKDYQAERWIYAKFRQEAVMLSVIELGREIKCPIPLQLKTS